MSTGDGFDFFKRGFPSRGFDPREGFVLGAHVDPTDYSSQWYWFHEALIHEALVHGALRHGVFSPSKTIFFSQKVETVRCWKLDLKFFCKFWYISETKKLKNEKKKKRN